MTKTGCPATKAVNKQPRSEPQSLGSVIHTFIGLILLASVALLISLTLGTILGWWRLVPVYTGSMRPAIPAGAAIIATPQSATDLEPHQIILFHSPRNGELLAHRIVDVSGDQNKPTITTKGDANAKVDPWTAVLQPGPIWKVRTVIPYVGAIIHLARNDLMEKLTFVVAAIGLGVAVLPRAARPAKKTST